MSTGPCYAYLFATPDYNTAPEGLGDCARDGRFGPGAVPLRGYGAGTKLVYNYDTSHVFVLGIDSASATVYRYTGPLGSQIYSPLTSVQVSAGSQARVKRALGLQGSLFAFEVDRDLTTFDPVAALASSDDVQRRDGGRMVAGNLRAIATAAALNRVGIGEDPAPNSWEYYNWAEIDYPLLGEQIAANDSWLFENARMTEILTGLVPTGRYRADVLSAAAHLIDAYIATIGIQVTDTASAAQFLRGIRGYLEPELVTLLRANSSAAAAAAQATTSATIRGRTEIFRDILPFPTTGFFFPTTDFFIGSNGAPISINTRWSATANGSILDNDLYWRTAADGGGLATPAQRGIDSISVSPANAARITATLSGDTITVNAVPGFSGTAYFDYQVTYQGSEQGTGRVFVLFR